ncbi:MAG: rhodanese-like domain-containing protein [Chitinophagaceae bacterium]|nr:rhodanese-like domain-containing protein [Chitinophagaceae bacterium]
MNYIEPNELKSWIDNGQDFQLIDVREDYERAQFNIGGLWIPLPEIMEHLDQIDASKPVVFYCKMGIRSGIALQRLEPRFPSTTFYNLKGGMEAWKKIFKLG